MYEANFGSAIDARDIRALRGSDIPRAELWTASFPCNDTSIAGGYCGISGQNSSMIHEFLRLVSEAGERRPDLILLENVLGFLMRDGGADLRHVLEALNDRSYRIDIIVGDAKWWVPQSRRRLFVVARHGLVAPSFWRPSTSRIRPEMVTDFIDRNADLGWHFEDVADPIDGHPKLIDIVERLDPADPRWWSKERTSYLHTQLSDRHLAAAIKMIEGPKLQYATVFRRVRRGRSMAEMRTDGVAGCLRTPRGGSGRQILIEAGEGRFAVRLLTPRECARLQGVPDSYIIPVKDNAALFGFGDAVCVPVVRWISDYFLRQESKIESESLGAA